MSHMFFPRLLSRHYDMIPVWLQPVEFRAVQSLDELKVASSLVYREYLARGYLKPAAPQLKLSIYHALPKTTTFIARHRRAGIITAVTLIEDSPLGLPMDDGYKTELDQMRRQGLRLVEVSMLAVDSAFHGTGIFSLFNADKLLLVLRLFKVLLDYVRSCTAAEELVACFNPKHHILFEFFGMQHLGGLKAYAGANGTPTVARHVTLAELARQTGHPAYRLLFGTPASAKPFTKKLFLSPRELRQLFVFDSSLFASASPTELVYIASCYPKYNFGAILDGAITHPSLASDPILPSTIP